MVRNRFRMMILPTPALSTDMEDTEDVFVCDYVLRK